MKFYRDNKSIYYFCKIRNNKLTSIYQESYYEKETSCVKFYKNGLKHNDKNAAYIGLDGYKDFCLENEEYGDEEKFTKESWRKFVKLQVFL
jgi:hypothetical protein